MVIFSPPLDQKKRLCPTLLPELTLLEAGWCGVLMFAKKKHKVVQHLQRKMHHYSNDYPTLNMHIFQDHQFVKLPELSSHFCRATENKRGIKLMLK